MIYGLYLSATGVLANSYRQDVIANNLANSETVGFKRDLAMFQEQRTEAAKRGLPPNRHSNPFLEGLGGGIAVAPTALDLHQGDAETTGNPMDVAIHGDGFFAVQQNGQVMLTRDGRFTVNQQGYLALATDGQEVLDEKRQRIPVNPSLRTSIGPDGTITQGKEIVGRIGVFDVPNRALLQKRGASVLAYPDAERRIRPVAAKLQSEAVERANVDPATELAALMDTQRQLEANANMIRCQDQTLARLVNDVGKIG